MVYLILALLLFTVLNLVAAAASRNINTNLVALLTSVGALVIPFVAYLPALGKPAAHNQKFGIGMALLTGLLVGAYALAVNKSFTENKIAIITPVVFGGTIFMMTILSYFIFKEKITLIEGAGLGLVLVGLVVIIYARAVTS